MVLINLISQKRAILGSVHGREKHVTRVTKHLQVNYVTHNCFVWCPLLSIIIKNLNWYADIIKQLVNVL
jgi:hypothetical protein